MAAEKSTEQRVKDIIVEQLGVNADQVTPDAKFIEDLGADSLDTVELVMALEEEFGHEIPDEEAEKLRDELNEEFYKHGRSASDFTQGQKVDAAKAFGILDGRASLEESAEFWILHHPVTGSVDIEVAIKAMEAVIAAEALAAPGQSTD